MRCEYVLTVGAAALLFATTVALGQSQHLTDAITHTQAAIAQGKQGYPDALATQAHEALRHAEAAKREAAAPRLDESIRLLKQAIEQSNQGQGEAATQAAERALVQLSGGGPPPAQSPQSPQEEGGY
jgi:hypothetical protein